MPAPHALYSKMLAERTAPRNVLVLFHLFIPPALPARRDDSSRASPPRAGWSKAPLPRRERERNGKDPSRDSTKEMTV
jgi:hypothetical protein